MLDGGCRKGPLDYLKERVNIADKNNVPNRLRTHLVSYELLSRAQNHDLEKEKIKSKLEPEFKEFKLTDRS